MGHVNADWFYPKGGGAAEVKIEKISKDSRFSLVKEIVGKLYKIFVMDFKK